ncbi:glycoside hydrolase N-terminal domain-containing protein [Rapidithrix thailandica]|uniref:Glycoside hydrolase N-terminal domain-containing protein n=1 Tax=Rapidithrix thailandica TaxID=413964 RepID=A0AAW9SDI0_9BACT
MWFDKPGKSFEESCPIGNGRLGAMDLGGIATDRIVLNESSMWSGGEQNLRLAAQLAKEENLESHVLAFDKRAMEIYYEWDDKKVDFINSLRDPQKSSFYKSVHSRMKMHYIRLAGVMECLRAACHESNLEYVTYPSSYAAAQLCEYYEEQILKVFNFINASPYKGQSGHFRVNWRKVFGGKSQLEARKSNRP